MKKVDNDLINRAHEFGLHVPMATIWLGEGDEIDRASLVRLDKNMSILEAAGASEITIRLNTPGGDVQQALGCYARIRQSSASVTVIGYGAVESSGAIILQAGDRRLLQEYTHVMYHQGTVEIAEMPNVEARAAVTYGYVLDRDSDLIVFEAIKSRRANYTRHKFNTQSARGLYLTADEAVDWGLADGISITT